MEITIQRKLAMAFEAFGGRVAIEHGRRMITYGELEQASGKVRDMLRLKGAQSGESVGILLSDRAELFTAILGILRAGCVFVPLDTGNPEERLKYMAGAADVRILLTDEEHTAAAARMMPDGTEIVQVRQEVRRCGEETVGGAAEEMGQPEDPIYIFFTSGSSGRPKAILGKNESLVHFVDWEIRLLGADEHTRFSQLTAPGFDAVLRDVFTPLCAGGTICIPEQRQMILESASLTRWLESSGVQVVHCTPTLFRLINNGKTSEEGFPDLRYILMSGERIHPGELKSWYRLLGERVQLVNLYGPSETTMVKGYYRIRSVDAGRKSIPIGQAMEGAELHILDENMQRCAEGKSGEICIATRYMTLGYYGNEALTRERFVRDASSGKLLYKTGDLGRRREDGNLEFLGRMDRQVKIRGNRIELGEIEDALLSYPGISACAADFRSDADEARYCVKCGLTSHYKGMTIGDEGVCNICKEYDVYKHEADRYFRTPEELKQKLVQGRLERNAEYDCLLLYSGGKDSTYVLYRLAEMGIKVLAFTFDNGYISNTALKNIDRIVKECNVNHVIGRVDEMNRVFLEGLQEECSVCNGCFKVLRMLSTRLAYEKGIKYVINGLSRGQIFDVKLYDVFQQGLYEEVSIEQAIFEQRLLYHLKDEAASRVLDKELHIGKEMLEQVELIDFYRFCDVSKQEILRFLQTKSAYWNNPEDTGFCSSNCLINDVGIYVQRKDRQYDNYAFPNSWEVRLGHISKEQSALELHNDVDIGRVERIMREIGYDEGLYEREPRGQLNLYYVADFSVGTESILEHLRRRLPDYMLPSGFMRLDSLPVTASGKLDYKSLPRLVKEDREFCSPRDEIEKEVAEIWKSIIGLERIGIQDNFLAIGGQSLNVMTMLSEIHRRFMVELPLEEVFNHATIAHISDFIKRVAKTEFLPVVPAQRKAYYRLSAQQMSVYSVERVEDAKTGYNITTLVDISGPLDTGKLERAFNKLVTRHESLRTAFKVVNGEPVQSILDRVDFKLDVLETNEGEVDRMVCEWIQPFDLERAPLLRGCLITTTEGQWKLVMDIHHLVTDGISVRILLRDLAMLYEGKDLAELPLQYKDFSEWQHKYTHSLNPVLKEKYWLDIFKGFVPNTGLLAALPVPAARVYEGGDYRLELEQEWVSRLQKISAENQITLFTVLFAAFNALYAKYTGQEDITIGIPADARKHPEMDYVSGMFVNVLAIRSYPQADKLFLQYMLEVQSVTLQAYEHKDYTFSDLSKALKLQVNSGGSSLFTTVFTMFNNDNVYKAGDVVFELSEDKTSTELYELRVIATVSPKSASVCFKYAKELFEAAAIERLAKDYAAVLDTISVNPYRKLKDISIGQVENSLNPVITEDFNFIFNF
jgi:amino acid adenylation domain-containing protein